jgi:hypothetical protein
MRVEFGDMSRNLGKVRTTLVLIERGMATCSVVTVPTLVISVGMAGLRERIYRFISIEGSYIPRAE